MYFWISERHLSHKGIAQRASPTPGGKDVNEE